MDAHTVTPRETLCAMVRAHLPTDKPDAAISFALDAGAIVDLCTGLYQPVGAAALEMSIAERLRRMQAGEEPAQLDLLGGSPLADAPGGPGYPLVVPATDGATTALRQSVNIPVRGREVC